MKEIKLEKLIGKHVLTGVDLYNKEIKNMYDNDFEDAECISFVLDGITYTAIEDPNDAYRSSLDKIGISKHKIKNLFPPVRVLVRVRPDDVTEEFDALEFLNIANGKIILTVGTGNTGDYYPYFISEFIPENMYFV